MQKIKKIDNCCLSVIEVNRLVLFVSIASTAAAIDLGCVCALHIFDLNHLLGATLIVSIDARLRLAFAKLL
jgi:hypothetical protein